MSNPFGAAITEQTVKSLSYYSEQEKITQVDCAREAMRFIHAEDKNLSALEYAWELKGRYGRGISTLVLVYNATGARVTLEQGGPNWHGQNFGLQPPRSFQNGQWIAFLHISGQGLLVGSEAARVFRGRDVNGRTRDFMVGWSILSSGANNAYTEIGNENYFSNRWSTVRRSLQQAKGITRAKDETCASTISIGGFNTSECIVVLQHQFSPLPAEL
ncbi:unnamed protein product [Urochloa decumbens]|uniref:23 kDa jasmonate-induced protein-like n=1 Tax=Urochloa decumbens TaxID=240449 RepID=A0ABC9AVF1_9POAL